MKKNGFTLIEILIVIVIIGVLAGALIPRIGTAKDSANDAVRVSYAQGVSSALIQYRLDHSDYPDVDENTKIGSCNCATLEDALGDSLLKYGYTSNSLPKDPVSDSSFEFCGGEVPAGQFVYCKLNDGILFVSHLTRQGGNAHSQDFDGTDPIDENTKRSDIESKLVTNGGDLYIYHGG